MTCDIVRNIYILNDTKQYCPTGRLFPREPVNFVHRKWTLSQEISKNISKVLTNWTYLYHFVYEKSFEFQQI